MIANFQCCYCRHLDPKTWGTGKCRAFPEGIPNDIILGKHNHNVPHPGDNGILFLPEDEAAAEEWSLPL